jgi:hypothetical protein
VKKEKHGLRDVPIPAILPFISSATPDGSEIQTLNDPDFDR